MQGRSFLRIMFESLFINNSFNKAIKYFINLCNNCLFYNKEKLKFSKKMPLNNIELNKQKTPHFTFNSITSNYRTSVK